MKQRIVWGLLGGVGLVFCVLGPDWLLFSFLAFLLVQSLREWHRLLTRLGLRFLPYFTYPASILFLLVMWAVYREIHTLLIALIGFFLLPVLFFVVHSAIFSPPYRFSEVAIALVSVWFFGFFFSLAWFYRHIGKMLPLEENTELPGLFPFLAAFCYDTSAFFSGKFWGRTPLHPQISPKKTWEGVVGGTLGLFLCLFLFHRWFFGNIPISFYQGILATLWMAFCAQCGDLFISIIKREARVKDSGYFLPGHGGILDRMDSALLTLPGGLLFAWLVIM
ncbi:MAG: phosphatidate cytidylyltransferase [bacterium JZ-2024 1]